MTVGIDKPTSPGYLRNKALFSLNKRFELSLKHVFLLTLFSIICVKANDHYTNEWAVEIEGGDVVANKIALTHGFINHGKILKNENFYTFSHPKLKKRSIHQSFEHHSKLADQFQVKWVEQQVVRNRVKRDSTYDPNHAPNDLAWSEMWYLLSSTQPNMKVIEAWQAGYTGKNVSVTILDDGIERTHPDLRDNYDPLASGDINGHDDDPSPRLDPTNENRHGTRCAGEVAAAANNNFCSVGIAYDGKIGGVRMLDGQVTDAVEAASIGFHPDNVDIYSASWGPDDDGRTVDGPAKLAQRAFIHGVTQGRGGKGSIFVWASGNGGRKLDNCNCDGYTNSIYTLSISSTTQRGTKPWYSESCSSTLAATYSSGSQGDSQIVTSDLRHGCTSKHTGTSASAPLAAAICALALEANPSLTWRDMQHLVVQTAKPAGLVVDDWVVNGVGRKVSHAFGYGMMDAFAMVTKARDWTMVPPQRRCTKLIISEDQTPRVLSSNAPIIVPAEVSSCDGEDDMIERLEHVQAELTLHNEHRGNLVIYLTSPLGTRSELLGQRRLDYSSEGFSRWAFMSTHTWDEDPRGVWKLEIHDKSPRSVTGTLSLYNLILYGTKHSDWPEKAKLATTTTTTTTKTTTTTTVATTTTPKNNTTTEANELSMSSTEKTLPSSTPMKAQAIKNNDKNCETSAASGTSCLVCKFPAILDPKTGHCVRSCGSGRYIAKEELPEGDGKNARFASVEVKVKILTDDATKRLVCRPCSTFCHSCAGPLATQCVQCVSGATFRKSDFTCILVDTGYTNRPSSDGGFTINIYHFTVVVVLTVIVVIASVFCLCRSKTSNFPHFTGLEKDYKPLYSEKSELPPPYMMRSDLEYRDDPNAFRGMNGRLNSQA